MDGFLPYFTGDGSVGLFSNEFDDIYHSAYGALSEAYEKFVLHQEINKSNLKVLDVCYGLGYNSKAFLNFIGKNKTITFDCLDIDKNLMFLSPFIKTNNKQIPKTVNDNLPKKQRDEISKYIRRAKPQNYKIDDWVNHILIKNLNSQFGHEYFLEDFFNESKNKPFFEAKMVKFDKFYQKWRINYPQKPQKRLNLHNIYYRYISSRYTYLENDDIKFNFYIGDARNTVQKLNNKYDYILLDAFTTDKCPQLWTIDFINELFNHTEDDGVLVTYSTSALVRNTMIEAGYFVGKIINKNNKAIGTICSRNKNKIKHNLTEYELGLLKTKAGIPYRDQTLYSTADEILKRREDEVKESVLISSSKYVKQYKGIQT